MTPLPPSTLTSVFSTALSGLQAADALAATSASNIANLDTPGYQARRLSLTDLPTGGVRTDRVTLDATEASPDTSNVDLSREVVQQVRAETLYAANAFVIKTADRMLGTLLDLFDTPRDRPPG